MTEELQELKIKIKRIQVFQLLQQCASELYGEVESDLIDFKELELSTKYKARFTAPRKTKRLIERELKQQKLIFAQGLDNYQKTVDKMMLLYDGVATEKTNDIIAKILYAADEIIDKEL